MLTQIPIHGKFWLVIVNYVMWTIIWNVFALAITWFLVLPEFLSGDYLIGFAFIFPIVGVLLLVKTIITIIRFSKYGRCQFVLTNNKAKPGEEISGVFYGMRSMPVGSNFIITLECDFLPVGRVQKYHPWKETIRTKKINSMTQEQQVVPISIQLPDGEPGVSWDRYIKYGDWILCVDLEGAGTHPVSFALPLVS